MMEYKKPEFYVEAFRVNDAVMACPEESKYNPVSVSCTIKSGSEMVFAAGTTGCNYAASAGNTKTIDANDRGYNQAEFDAKTYFYWYGAANGAPEDGGVYWDFNENNQVDDTDKANSNFGVLWGNALKNALTALGVAGNGTYGDGQNGVLHAGLLTSDIVRTINSSY